jgi:O-antigen/teichoic acid export membrane protein
MGVLALVLAWSISFALSAAYQLLALPIPLRPSWRPRLLSRMLRFGAPLQLTRILWFASGRVHVVLLATLAGPAAVAYYAVAARIPEALQNLSDSFVRVYFPTMTTMLAGGQRREAAAIMNRSLALISFAGALGALTTALFSRELVGLIFSEKYLASAPALALLMLALHMTVVVNVLGYTLTADGRPGWSLAVDVVRAGASAIGDLLLIPGLGVTGAAAAAAVAAYAGKPLAVWAVRRGGVPAAVAPCLRQTGALLACAGAGWWLDPAPPYRLLLLALFVAVTAPPLLLARQPVEPAWPAAAEPVT